MNRRWSPWCISPRICQDVLHGHLHLDDSDPAFINSILHRKTAWRKISPFFPRFVDSSHHRFLGASHAQPNTGRWGSLHRLVSGLLLRTCAASTREKLPRAQTPQMPNSGEFWALPSLRGFTNKYPTKTRMDRIYIRSSFPPRFLQFKPTLTSKSLHSMGSIFSLLTAEVDMPRRRVIPFLSFQVLMK